MEVSMVTLLYYLLVAFISALLVYNLARSKSWERDVLYVIVLVPFLLRLFRLK
jgi:ABC-type spermidine/putrescine transport system permease subunit I